MKSFTIAKLENFGKYFTDADLWAKLAKYAKSVGKEGVRNALRLYYVLQKKDLPVKAKATIYGALGYLISPIDFIPDMIPVAGFTDDIAGLALAVSVITMHIDDEVNNKVDEKMRQWFG